jgi:molybdate transport system ATP-binding protein
MVYVSHNTDEVARLADTLVLIKEGRAVASGPIHELLTRLDLPLAHEPNAESLLEGRVIGQNEEHHLTEVASAAGRFLVIQQGLGVGDNVRLRIAARDVSVTLSEPSDTSILNRFPATIETVAPTGDSQMTIRLIIGDAKLLSRVTRKSAIDLSLEPGKSLYAQVKSVALLG